MIPEPDYNEDETNKNNNSIKTTTSSSSIIRQVRSGSPNMNNSNSMHLPHFDEEGLVIPRKPQNPCIESSERKSLHKEMLWNQKVLVFYLVLNFFFSFKSHIFSSFYS
jgi:hypothetical protein